MKHNHPTQQGGNAAGMPQKRKMNKAVLSRTIRMLHGYYPVLVPVSVACIVLSAIVAVLPAIFLQQVTDVIDHCLTNGTPWDTARGMIIPKVMLLIGFYVLSIIAVTVETQLSAVVTQGFLGKMRKTMFDRMQNLPIRYFDTHKHGDIMSYYTNDIDTLRQLIGQSLPTLIRAGTIVVGVFFVMLYYSIWLTLVLLLGVIVMVLLPVLRPPAEDGRRTGRLRAGDDERAESGQSLQSRGGKPGRL